VSVTELVWIGFRCVARTSKILFEGKKSRSAANHSRVAELAALRVCRSVRTCFVLIILALAASLALRLRPVLADEHSSHHGGGSSGGMEGEMGGGGGWRASTRAQMLRSIPRL
jgi:hypothetical protein